MYGPRCVWHLKLWIFPTMGVDMYWKKNVLMAATLCFVSSLTGSSTQAQSIRNKIGVLVQPGVQLARKAPTGYMTLDSLNAFLRLKAIEPVFSPRRVGD